MSAGDMERGVALLRSAAEAGLPEAQYNLGVARRDGIGAAADRERARYWFERAAAAGDANAQWALSQLLEGGAPSERAAARRWLTAAAQAGNDDAQFELGRRYLHGDGVHRSSIAGIRWFALAARQGHEAAAAQLAAIAPSLPARRVRGNRVNVRERPDTGAPVIRQVDAGLRAYRIESRRGWSQLYFPDDHTVGYVAESPLEPAL